ncbi:spermidine/putrescine ABC transporter substrate-binding protein [Anaerocolumna cellulosilytica]|uniref:Spermidine/putrescine ABC transporter substrate-binding protein n=1 Tax=Anaerocolumna cellulosilytica TaxID=433286 RepID=A0A6S6QY84_9FIRM|nr:spermidine/putrescine-binding protein [Anaerocolumna cellulosilytica]BCJ95594.1 spermidine/putrescine ABC transporter substrate-binding protein [Anaerocolumna cellulosilytica]
MRKKIAALLLASVCAFSLVGCQKSDQPTLYVYNWGEYIDPDVIDLFEDETGIKVEYNEFVQNEDMYPVIQTGSVKYDVVCPSDYMIQKMIQEDMLAEINYENVPNISNIDSLYLKSAEEFDPGNKYSVPYCWGTVGILYNKTMINTKIDSWDALFDKDFIEANGYSGDILMIDSVRDALGIALTYLGYPINSADEAQLEEAKQLLQEQFPMVDAYVVDQVRDKMIGGDNPIGVIYSGEAIFTQRENADLEYVVPKEGSNVWIDGWVIPKNAQNKEYAEKWINFMCDPEIALKNFEYITYSTPNAAARDLIEDADIKNSTIAFPEASVLERCSTYQYLGEDMDALYLQKWNEVKSN